MNKSDLVIYYNMDPKIIFDTALNDIPILKKFIDKEILN